MFPVRGAAWPRIGPAAYPEP